jgi:hypothetical protein
MKPSPGETCDPARLIATPFGVNSVEIRQTGSIPTSMLALKWLVPEGGRDASNHSHPVRARLLASPTAMVGQADLIRVGAKVLTGDSTGQRLKRLLLRGNESARSLPVRKSAVLPDRVPGVRWCRRPTAMAALPSPPISSSIGCTTSLFDTGLRMILFWTNTLSLRMASVFLCSNQEGTLTPLTVVLNWDADVPK